MKIHQITEAPRIEPKIGGIGTGTAPSGPTLSAPSGSKPITGITGTKAAFANKNGGVSKGTIVGPAKNGNPNQVSFKDSKGKTFNVSIKKLLDPKKLTPLNIGLGTSTTTAAPKADAPKPKLTGDPKADLKTDPKPETDSQKPKAKFKMGWKSFGAFGAIISAGLLGQEIIESSGEYAEAIDRHNGDTSHPDVQKARQYLANVCADAVVQLFLSIASGAVAGSIASRALVGIPGAGWIAAILAGGATTIVSYAASKAAKGEAFIDSIARWMMRNIDDDLLRNLTDDVSAGSEKAQAKDAMKDLILNDPKMMQAFKKAKAIKAAA
jgi:hypothetical protein